MSNLIDCVNISKGPTISKAAKHSFSLWVSLRFFRRVVLCSLFAVMVNYYNQKQLLTDAWQKSCFATLWNRLLHRCFLVNYSKFVRVPLLENFYEWLMTRQGDMNINLVRKFRILVRKSQTKLLNSHEQQKKWFLCYRKKVFL